MSTHEQQGFTVWFTGLSGSGKSTIAEMLFHEFQARELAFTTGAQARKLGGVHQHAEPFHASQHRQERELDLLE